MPFESNIVQVGMSGDGVVSRRGFLRTLGLGAAGLTGLAALPVSFTDLMVLQADELRKRQMACILLWMAGGPSQLETFDPKPGTEHGGSTKAIETSVPGISVAQGWDQTARVMKEIALVRSMTNKEGNHQRATYQLHTGYVPTATVKHPNIGCSIAAELGESKFDLPHIVSVGGPTIGAGFLARRSSPSWFKTWSGLPITHSPRWRWTASNGGSGCSTTSRPWDSVRPAASIASRTIEPCTPSRPGWCSRPR